MRVFDHGKERELAVGLTMGSHWEDSKACLVTLAVVR